MTANEGHHPCSFFSALNTATSFLQRDRLFLTKLDLSTISNSLKNC